MEVKLAILLSSDKGNNNKMKTIKTMMPMLLVLTLPACNNETSEQTKTDTTTINTPVYSPSPSNNDTASYEKMINKTNDSTP